MSEEEIVAAVDAAMVEMENIHPPLRRSECERLIKAAIAALDKHREEQEFAPLPTLEELEAKERAGTLFGLERIALDSMRLEGNSSIGINRAATPLWRVASPQDQDKEA